MKQWIFLFGSVLLFAQPVRLVAQTFPAYYDISDTAKAQAEARQRNLPIAYLGSFPESLTEASPDPDSFGDLSQMALKTLQGQAVVIFFDGHNMGPVPDMIHGQYHIKDDGPLDGGAAWIVPKVVFCNADISKILGRVSRTQMAASREVALNTVLQSIRNDPTALVPAPLPPLSAAAQGLYTTTEDVAPPDTPANYFAQLTGMTNESLYKIGGALVGVALLFSLIGRLRR
jgi:hypothetical protein